MVAGCGMKCVKFTIFLFNFLFLLIGIALIIIGGYAMSSIRELSAILPALNIGPIIVIVVGSMVFVPSFFGCCGAIRENRCMLITYAVLMGILMLLELIVAIVGFVYATKVRDTVQNAMTTMMNEEKESGMNPLWAMMSQFFSCCGIHGPMDWKNKDGANTNVPIFCCIERGCNTSNVLNRPLVEQEEVIFTSGCLDGIESRLKSFLLIISGIAIGIASIELIGIIFASCLAKAVKLHD